YHPGGGPNNYLNSVAIKPFEPFGDRVAALTMTVTWPGNHGLSFMAGGANSWYPQQLNSSTLDQQIADTIGHRTPLRCLSLGVQTGGLPFIYRKGLPLPTIDTPQQTIDSIMRQFSAAPVKEGISRYDREYAQLSAHKQGLNELFKRIGNEERFKLEEHLAALERYPQRIEQRNRLVSDGPCGAITYTPGTSPLNLYRAQGDIAVTALACGLTNVAAIQFNNTQETWEANDGTPDAVPVVGDMKQVVNGGIHRNYYANLNEYMNKGVAHIVNQLISAGIFNDTVVLCVTEMGNTEQNTPEGGPITAATGISGFKGGARKLNNSHYAIFPDVVRLLGLEWAVNETIYDYGAGGIIV
ncbi:MAG TPA: DUF1552 domain-containing protein, partial [Cellvibrionaceae bacterium]|nr:DUF1552 domain-containing protein [Cellvibrionaceae bacterium]